MAQYDDPFGDSDGTVLKPTPGGRAPAPAPSQGATRLIRRPPPLSGLPPRSGGLNPLEQAAAALLALLPRLRNAASHPDPAGLRQQLIEEIKAFDERARAAGRYEPTLLKAARYVLCTAVDDAVLNTPWGGASVWRQQSLLITFHNEAWGGEKFFQLLESLLKDPGRNIALLELMYVCLALGFQGRYRVLPDGRNRLEEIREQLYHTIRTQRGEFERELAPHWRGVTDRRNPLLRYVPLWVIAALAGLLLTSIYLFFHLRLSDASEPVFALLDGMGRTPVAPGGPRQEIEKKPDPRVVDLRAFLAPEIDRKQVAVVNRPDGTAIVIFQPLFASGSALVDPAQAPLLQRIAEALNATSAPQARVIGHTDNVPIKSARLRFADNYQLSVARAEAVKQRLSDAVGAPDRFAKAEGRGEREPIADNATADGRARNRRVEIVLLAKPRRTGP